MPFSDGADSGLSLGIRDQLVDRFDGRGEVIHEPEGRLLSSQRLNLLGLSALVFGTGGAMGWLAYHYLPTEERVAVPTNAYFAVLFIAVGVYIGLLYLAWAAWYRPTRVHSGGIAVAQKWGGDLFVPWRHWKGKASNLTFKGPYLEQARFDPSIPSAERVVAVASERMGDDRYGSTEYGRGLSTRLCVDVVLTGIGVVIVSGFIVWPSVAFLWLPVAGLATVIAILLVFSIGIFFYAGSVTTTSRMAWQRHVAPSDHRPTMTLVATVLAMVVALGTTTAFMPDVDPHVEVGTFYQEPDPEVTMIEPGIYAGMDQRVNGSIRVGDGESLMLVDCRLEFEGSSPGHFGIWVGEGGTLVLLNTTLTARSIDRGFFFEVYGNATIRGSVLQHIWGHFYRVNGNGGLEVYSDNVRIENTTFRDCQSNGIMVAECSPLVVNCVFTNIHDDAIEVQGGSPKVVGCEITECYYGVWAFASDGTIEGSVFKDNTKGVYLEWSDTAVLNCTFVGTRDEAIFRTRVPNSRIEGNTFEGNGRDIVSSYWGGSTPFMSAGFLLVTYCLAIGVTVAIVLTAIFLLDVRYKVRALETRKRTLDPNVDPSDETGED